MVHSDGAASSASPAETSAAGATPRQKIYRLRKGTKVADLPPRPPHPAVPTLASLDGPFQLAEYLALVVRNDPHDLERLVKVPTSHEGPTSPPSSGNATGGSQAESDLWIYEHLRRLPIDLTPLLTTLLPICNRETCPQMKAGEWLYLCVAHGTGGTEECCAIDYVLHTLDSTTALLNSSKTFPSRLSIPSSSLRHFPALFRRLSRIFSHAFFHHREAFQLAEAETGLYARFVALCEEFGLVEKGLLVVPIEEALGKAHSDEDDDSDDDDEEDEDEEEVSDEDDAARGREAARQDASAKRPHSLGRHPTPDPESTIAEKPSPTLGSDDPSSARPRNTLSRGTRGRGSLWPIPSASPSSPSLTTETSTQSVMEASPTKRPIGRTSISPRASAKDAEVVVADETTVNAWPGMKSSESTESVVRLSDLEAKDEPESGSLRAAQTYKEVAAKTTTEPESPQKSTKKPVAESSETTGTELAAAEDADQEEVTDAPKPEVAEADEKGEKSDASETKASEQ